MQVHETMWALTVLAHVHSQYCHAIFIIVAVTLIILFSVGTATIRCEALPPLPRSLAMTFSLTPQVSYASLAPGVLLVPTQGVCAKD